MRKRIGDFFIERGLITPAQREEILRHAADTGLRFGDAGLELGLLTRDGLERVLGPRYDVDFFQLDPAHLPQETRALLAPDAMIRLGAVPLGFKTRGGLLGSKRFLNVGLLDPGREDALAEVREAAQKAFGPGEVSGVTPFLILADQFIALLDRVYGVNEGSLAGRAAGNIDESLRNYLER